MSLLTVEIAFWIEPLMAKVGDVERLANKHLVAVALLLTSSGMLWLDSCDLDDREWVGICGLNLTYALPSTLCSDGNDLDRRR